MTKNRSMRLMLQKCIHDLIYETLKSCIFVTFCSRIYRGHLKCRVSVRENDGLVAGFGQRQRPSSLVNRFKKVKNNSYGLYKHLFL